mgnify:CR=1 FL=1
MKVSYHRVEVTPCLLNPGSVVVAYSGDIFMRHGSSLHTHGLVELVTGRLVRGTDVCEPLELAQATFNTTYRGQCEAITDVAPGTVFNFYPKPGTTDTALYLKCENNHVLRVNDGSLYCVGYHAHYVVAYPNAELQTLRSTE